MTTTTDSRIRADWTLDALPGPECSPLPPGVPSRSQAGHLVDQMTPELRAEMEAHWARAESPIDTSTTAGKISVMAAADRGETVQQRAIAPYVTAVNCHWAAHDGRWDWTAWDYRIAPPPVARTALQRARERTRAVLVDEATTGDVQLAMLVREIDVAPAVWFGSTLLDKCGIVGHAPGRYRLVRDDQ